jgi:hypothetical protein
MNYLEKSFLIKNLAFTVLLFASHFNASTQDFFRTEWEKTYSENQSSKISSTIKLSDGSFIYAGETTSPTIPGQKILLIKTAKDGETIWQKTFGDKSNCTLSSVALDEDDNVLILASKQDEAKKNIIWVFKVDKIGKLLWESKVGGGEFEYMYDLCEAPNQGVMLCGSKIIKGNNDSDGWLIKLNKRGAIESQVLLGSRFIHDEFKSIIPSKDGGFLLAGTSSVKMGGEKIPYLVQVDSRGNKIWEKTYPDLPGVIPSLVYYSSEGLIECLMNAYSKTGESSGIVKIQLDISGNILNTYRAKRNLNISKNAFSFLDGDQLVLLSVQNENPSAFSDKYIIKLDPFLSPVWIKPIELENVTLRTIATIDNANFISVGWAGQSSYKNEILAVGFHDFSVQLMENYINQRLIATAGKEVNESLSDFKSRIGQIKYESFFRQFSQDAVKDLRLIPDAIAENTQSGHETRPSLMASVIKDPGTSGKTVLEGKYYALLIAINDYQDPSINDLDKPISDAQKLFDVLVSEYLFEKANVTFLKNPTREQIISTLDRLEKEISKNDNLLIFYAGHGFWNESSQKGFWLPSDASKQNTANWIGNSSISDYIRSIPAKHTLLIADACFSGSIFKTRAAFGNQDMSTMRLYELPSRKAMTSGTLTEVPDKSVFIEFLVKRLYENKESFLASEQLFFSFKPAVLNNTETIPQYGVVGSAGDEGGDFIFIRR